jgi:hypothetical protein
MVSGTISPPYSGYFSPFPHGTCSLSVSQEYLALPDGAGSFKRSFTGSALLRIPTMIICLRVPDYHRLWPNFPDVFHFALYQLCRSYNPTAALTAMVWALPRSLATTCGITFVFSSSGYLDVSVPRVRPPIARGNWPSASWVFPFGNLRINSYLPIPAAYRSLSRPSSPLRAKAFPIRPSLLSSVSRIFFARKPNSRISMTLSQHVKERYDQFYEP